METLKPLPRRYSISVQEMEEMANRIEYEIAKLQEIGRAPHNERILRQFRFGDAKPYMDDIGEHRWQTWIQNNVMSEIARERSRSAKPGALSPHRLTLGQIHQMMEHYKARPRRPSGADPMVCAIAQFKGGSSKTTTCLHLSHYLALRGYRVLVVDFDPQGTLTRFFGLDPRKVDEDRTFYGPFIQDDFELKPMPTHFDGLDIIPSTMNISQIDIELAVRFKKQDPAVSGFYNAVERAISTVRDQYDFVLLDTPPAFSLTAIAVMWGVNSILTPMPPEGPDFAGTADFLTQTAQLTKWIEEWEGKQKIWAPFIVIHGRDKGSIHAEMIKSAAGTAMGHYRLSMTTPDNRSISAAQDLYKSVYEIGPSDDVDSRGAKKAREAMDEVWKAVEQIFVSEWAYQVLPSAQALPSAEVA